MPKWLRSILSVVVGFVIFYALQGACTMLATKVFHLYEDTRPLVIANVLYTWIAAVLGGYVAARMAASAPVAHGVGVAALMVPLMVMNLNKGVGSQWTLYVILRSAGSPLLAIAGSALEAQRRRRYAS